MNSEETEISSASQSREKMDIDDEIKKPEENEEISEKSKDADEVLDTSLDVNNPGVSFSQSEDSKDTDNKETAFDNSDIKNDEKNQETSFSEIADDKNSSDIEEKPIENVKDNKETSEKNPLEINDDNKSSDVINPDDMKDDETQADMEEMKDEEDTEKPLEIEAVELAGEPEKINMDEEESHTMLESSSNEIEEINPIETSEASIATDQLEEDVEEQTKEQDSLFVNDSTDIIEENSKEQDDYDDFNKSKCPDENFIDKDEDPANNIEYVDFQDNLDKDNLAEKDPDDSNADGPMEVDENPLLIKDYKDENDKDNLSKDVLLDEDQDPIASDGFNLENEEGADEELCIIPDTERVISEAEKEAAISIPPLKDITEASTSTDNAEDSTSIIEVTADDSSTANKYIIKKYGAEDIQSCSQCILQRKAKYIITKNDKTEYICTDTCLDNFKTANEDNYVLNLEGEIRVKNFTASSSQIPKLNFERKCVVCKKKTDDEENNLTWEIMDFCNEYCLAKYQKEIGSVCASCNSEVRANSLGKYCVRFGNDIRQFCSSHCLEEYKKGLKVCSYCQQDMSIESDGFLAPVGDKGQFKDFCSQICMEKYDIMTNNRPPKVDEGTKCSVCKLDKPITTEYKIDEVNNYFCGDPCLVAFSFVNNITPAKCSMCRRYFSNEILEKNTMFYDNVQYGFCSNSCQNIYIIAHRKIVPCAWCKVKKYNFDMIRRYFKTGPVLNMCSINCLSFFQVSVNAVHLKKTVCNFCNKRHQPMYHLTMSDATIRNFCSYSCVMSFQNKFKKSPITLNEAENPVPTGEPKKNKKFAMQAETPSSKSVSPPPLPVITNVQSLAKGETTTTRSTRAKSNSGSQHILNANVDAPVKIKHHIIIKPQVAKEQRNVSTMCKVKTLHKGANVKPSTAEKECQTDQREADKILIPIPIPVYIPSPLPMYSVPAPFPLPFPIPIPVPIFIPTTRNSAKGIMKEIKKIQVKIPTDPYEAELLMMAEMVAGDKKTEENTDSESDVDDTAGGDDGSFSPEPVDASNTFGDDMLQMALKMATEELEEPAVDLEGALTANTITAPQGSEPSNEEAVDDPQPILNMGDRPVTYRGRKRGRGNKQNSSTKRRRVVPPVDMQPIASQPVPPPEPTEKPDAHLCLKYTFGVNAWKQWVTTKNAELEKQTKYVKPFKTEILQLTADELNFSLCLFVKEVRKPNGAEYAPDTIYYLCLGIQQYLFENNRIDNIFCDPYYEQFTDSLDEVARKFSVLYNDSHYIVTRVEEEHLWESKQLGAHSPHVLLSTLMFFNTKHFNLTSVQEHMQLSFSHIMKHWKRNPNQPGVARTPGSRNVLLRFYPPQSAIQNNTRKKKVYEQQENDDNPLRCPVKLYEFYLSKCPESVKTRNDVFYLQPERSCVPDSPVWYSTSALAQEALEKMLHRVKMVKEINVALLTS